VPWPPSLQPPRALFGVESFAILADKIDGRLKPDAVDDNFDLVSVAYFSDRAARQGFRGNMPEASPTISNPGCL